MAQIGDSAHTSYGPGVVTEIDTVRGRTSLRVAGNGFNVWLDQAKVHTVAGLETTIDPGGSYHVQDNSTTLPYNPDPQHHVDLFRHDQNIQPGEFEIDKDDRLHSSDSVSFSDKGDNRPYPGPNPDLFAKDASYYYADNAGVDPSDPTLAGDPQSLALSTVGGPPSTTSSTPGEAGIDRLGYSRYSEFEDDPSRPEWGDDDWHKELPDGPERTLDKAAGWHYATEGETEDISAAGGTESLNEPRGAFHPAQPASPNVNAQGIPQLPYNGFPGDYTSKPAQAPLGGHTGTYRPAGLSDRYAAFDLEAETHPANDISRFRQDPYTFIASRGHAMSDWDDQLAHKYADYTHLLSGDATLRTAAHDDIAVKASLLNREGRVHIADRGDHRIYAQVQGDHGVYEALISRTGDRVAAWHCGCEWGRWAFANRMTDLNQLCSHARAAYLHLPRQASVVDSFSSWLKDNNRSPDAGAIADYIHTEDDSLDPGQVQQLYTYIQNNPDQAPERKYDVGYENDPDKVYKSADMLRLRPESLQPQIHEVPEGEDEKFVDVTKDERETTGPDDIVHFSSKQLLASLHYVAEDDGLLQGEIDQAGAGGNVTAALHRHAVPMQPGPGVDWSGKKVTVQPQSGPAVGDGGQQFNTPFVNNQRGQRVPNPTPAALPQPAQQPALAGDVKPVPGPGQPPAPVGGTPPPTNDYKQQYPREEYGQQPAAGAPGTPALQGPHAPGQAVAPTPQGMQPDGSWQHSLNTSPTSGDSYTVKPGDTLSDIAQRSGVGDYNELAKSNGISNPNMITPGQQIKLPGAGGGAGSPGAQGAQDAIKAPGAPSPEPGGPSNAAQGAPPTPGLSGPKPPPTGTPPTTLNQGLQQGLKAAQPPAPPSLPKPPSAQPPAPPPLPTPGKQSARHAADDIRPSTSEASGMLDELRDISQQDPHYQDMAGHNDKVSDLVEALQNAGVDASYFVASLHDAAPSTQRSDTDPSDGDANFRGLSNPNWADEPFEGSGPDPKWFMGDSGDYIDKHERPDFSPEDWHEDDGSDIIKFNDSRSKPQQGPRQSSLVASLHYALDPNDDSSGMFNPNNPGTGDWDAASGQGFVNEVSKDEGQLGGGGLSNALGGGGKGGEAGGAAEGGAAEAAPELLAVAAFDRGEIAPAPTARRAGGGPRQEVRVDPGFRGQPRKTAAPPPEDFGYDGEPSLDSYEGASGELGGGGDILASFQRSGAAGAIMSNSGPTGNDDIANAAQAFLRTAGRKFSPEEQRMLEAEAHPMGARNLPTDDELQGTHYLLGM